jgi:hypothetical protein
MGVDLVPIQKKNGAELIKEVLQSRTWDPIIYSSQVHDPFDRYGCRMMHIHDSFRGKEIKNNFRQMLIMGNMLLVMASGCTEVYRL